MQLSVLERIGAALKSKVESVSVVKTAAKISPVGSDQCIDGFQQPEAETRSRLLVGKLGSVLLSPLSVSTHRKPIMRNVEMVLREIALTAANTNPSLGLKKGWIVGSLDQW